jgi:hypothetical protein
MRAGRRTAASSSWSSEGPLVVRRSGDGRDEAGSEGTGSDARGPGGRTQIGDVQARSWIVFGTAGSSQVAGRCAAVSALHAYAVQRQDGFSITRA